MREKFSLTVSASRAKKILCNGNRTMRYMKPSTRRRHRRTWNEALRKWNGEMDEVYVQPRRCTSWDIA